MKTLADLGRDDYRPLPEISVESLRLLWPVDYWDGPLSGMLLYTGKKWWFQPTRETDAAMAEELSIPYTFLVVELTDEQVEDLESWHELFRQKVGKHTDYDDTDHRDIGALQPRARWREFYDAQRERIPPDFSGNAVAGWFSGTKGWWRRFAPARE